MATKARCYPSRRRSPKGVPHVESCTCYWVGGAAARDGFDDRIICHDNSAAVEKRDQRPQQRSRPSEMAELLARPLGKSSLQLVLARPLGTRSLWVRAGMLHSESSLRQSIQPLPMNPRRPHRRLKPICSMLPQGCERGWPASAERGWREKAEIWRLIARRAQFCPLSPVVSQGCRPRSERSQAATTAR